jgi:uncharacterized protein (UPF0335 family)
MPAISLMGLRLGASGFHHKMACGNGDGLAILRRSNSSNIKDGQAMAEGSETIGGIAAEALQQYVDRIEKLEEEKKALAEDIKQVYSEAKSTGFDTKILRKIISLRKIEEHERQEQEELLDLYKRAIGME